MSFPVGESEYVDITLKIVNRKFNQSLTDRTSEYFRDTATTFCREVGAISVCNSLKNVFRAINTPLWSVVTRSH